MAVEQIILGIDPGTLQMGFAVLKSHSDKHLEFIYMDVLNLTKIKDPALKLKKIFETTFQLIKQYHPDAVAIESPFFGKNVQAMLKLGRAQGVAIAAAMVREVAIFEYAPRKIKQSITGKGTASKEQVSLMLQRFMLFDASKHKLDATDALAAAACHAFQNKLMLTDSTNLTIKKSIKKKSNSWEHFVANNSDRIK